MRTYKLLAASLGGFRVHYKGERVYERDFPKGAAEKYVAAGYLERIKGEPEIQADIDFVKSIKPRLINVTSYQLWLGGGERLIYNVVSNSKYESIAYSLEGGIKYTNSDRFKLFNNHNKMSELFQLAKDDTLLLHDPGAVNDPSLLGHENVVWFAHGAHFFQMDVSRAQRPKFVLSNYMPKAVHPSWNDIEIKPICLGVNLSQFVPPKTIKSNKKFFVGIIGRISSEKIPLIWFDSIKKINTLAGLEFRFFGKADKGSLYFKQFCEQVSQFPNMVYCGELEKEQIQTAYQKMDLLCVPSQSETGSYAIVEAQLCGLRVFALNRDGIPNHITSRSRVFESYEAMATALSKEVKPDSLVKRKKQSELAGKRHSLKKWMTDIDATLAPLMERDLKRSKQLSAKMVGRSTIKTYSSFTDGYDCARTDVTVIPPVSKYDNRAKDAGRAKYLFWEYGIQSDVNMWVDGNIYPLAKPEEYIELLGDSDICLFRHPWRDCIYEEATETLNLNFDLPEIVIPQLEAYKKSGYPKNNGLAETGVMIRRDSPTVRRFLIAVWKEIERGSHRDQLCFNYVLSKFPKLRIKYLPPSVRTHSMFNMVPHQKHMAVINGKLMDSSIEKTFTKVLKDRFWVRGDNVSLSGSGLKSVVDCPCGDYNWQHLFNSEKLNYHGLDIVADLVEANKKHETQTTKFSQADLTCDKLPAADLIIVRDCFVHLPTADVVRGLLNIALQDFKFVAVTHFVKPRGNTDTIAPKWRPINFRLPPYSFPFPKAVLIEQCTEGGGEWDDKALAIYSTEQLRYCIPKIRL